MSNKLAPIDELKKNLTMPAMKEQFKAALPPHIDVDKFTRVLMTAISGNRALVEADRSSLYSACLKCAADGLLPDGREAAIVSYGSQAAYLPMVGGILKKVRNSGELSMITSQVVHRNDDFRYWVDEGGEHINHEPNLFEDRGEPIMVYALAKTKDGGVYIEVMTKKDVEAIKKVSKGAAKGPWAGAFEFEMWRKSVIKRLSKRLPMSTDIDQTIHADDELYAPEPTPEETKNVGPEVKDKTKPSKLKNIMQEKQEPIEAESSEVQEEVIDRPAVLGDDDLPL